MVVTTEHQPLTQDLTEADCWQAVQNRDASYAGKFYYGVKSTGIYCRPGCPSRQPGRAQVVFFSSVGAAEDAGFRACQRCEPQLSAPPAPDLELVRGVCEYIEANPDTRVTLAQLGQIASVSPYHLQRVFKRVTGVTPRQYADSRRLGTFKNSLQQTNPTITEALYEAGYGSSSRLYELAASQLGMTPATYRRGALDQPIAYTVVECPLGLLLVAATQRGICAVSLGEEADSLTAGLRQEFPAAVLHREDTGLRQWTQAILQHLEGQLPHLDLPLDIRATAFQRLVWEQLRKIPYGETRSYSEIAEELNQPKAARAVAQACATNPVPLLVPCHRVVRRNGKLGGYRYGISR
ncbi:MAG: bifunctional DNA-binding transcriptional regulator/O6-methylguanine-DNA methyltransferase Ada, partial [Dehalococcoidia bacterium]